MSENQDEADIAIAEALGPAARDFVETLKSAFPMTEAELKRPLSTRLTYEIIADVAAVLNAKIKVLEERVEHLAPVGKRKNDQ